MRVCKLQNIQRPCIWYFQSCRTGQQFAVQLEVWGVVQLLNPTNWKTSRGLIPVIVQAQRLKALPFSDIWDSTFYLCVPIYAHEEKLVHDIEVAFEALLNLSNWKTSQGLVKVLNMQRAIPDIWQFWGATTQFRPVKGHQKMRKFVTE